MRRGNVKYWYVLVTGRVTLPLTLLSAYLISLSELLSPVENGGGFPGEKSG